MPSIRVVSISAATASYVRERRIDPVWSHSAVSQPATGFGPCRACLRRFSEGGERRLLFTHDSFAGIEERTQPGPVFIHENHCDTYSQTDQFPSDLEGLDLTFEGVGSGCLIREAVRAPGSEGLKLIGELLAREDVDYVNVRNSDAGCYVLRAEPASTQPLASSRSAIG